MFFLNWLSVFSSLVSYFNLDQRYGPKYLNECFPNEVLLYLGMLKSAFLRVYCIVLLWFRTIQVPYYGVIYF